MADLRIDVFRLAQRGEVLAGRLPIARMERLVDALVATGGEIEWRVRGWRQMRAGIEPEDFFELSFDAVLQPPCMRCLEAVEVRVADTRRYRLVHSEEEAERLDPDDDAFDVLAGDARFDLAALIEDELILALPAMPRHDTCRPDRPAEIREFRPEQRSLAGMPAQPGRSEVSTEDPEGDPAGEGGAGPFAGLRRLRREDSSSG